uniref:Uncharacterized protein n=1 Tax=Sphaerodactylus townsendi TaxID=933632 RepID=A0ACB8EQM9_9SAUR
MVVPKGEEEQEAFASTGGELEDWRLERESGGDGFHKPFSHRCCIEAPVPVDGGRSKDNHMCKDGKVYTHWEKEKVKSSFCFV